MDQGWIKLHRKSKSHWLYQKKPFDEWHAWEDIMLSVNREQKKFMHGSTLLTVEPGQVVTSLRGLGERWGWNQEKVRRFLNRLASDAMLDVECDTTKTVVTIANWSFYQKGRGKARHDCDTAVTRIVTNKKVKKEENISCRNSPDGESDAQTDFEKNAALAAGYMAERILKHTPNFPQLREDKRDETVARWAKDIEKLLRIDRVDFEDFKRVLAFCQVDPFWQKNILSGKKLREQYGRLLVEISGGHDE